jgi:hypothetical protein
MPEKSTLELLQEMQTGLELVMIAIKKSDVKEAERVCFTAWLMQNKCEVSSLCCRG